MATVLLASLFHETHCFVDDRTGLDQFRVRRGDEIMARAGDGSGVDGFLEVATDEGWAVIPAADYAATPSGPVEHSVFEAFWEEVEAALLPAITQGLDGIFLGLHGAMVTTEEPDIEGELLRRIRSTAGAEALPVFGAFDLHANLTPAMCALADGLVCYRECPHIDARETSVRAARLLAQALREGRRPHMRYRQVPLILAPTGTATADLPMRALEAAAREAETDPALLAVNVVAGFAFADQHDAGVAFCAVSDNSTVADAALDRLAAIAWAHRDEGAPSEWDPDEVLQTHIPGGAGPTILVEPADNIGGGAPGDCTDVLRALLRHRAEDAGVILADPAAVAAFDGAAPGTTKRLPLGGRGSRLDPGPVELEVTLLRTTDGHFTLEDRQSHMVAAGGVHVDMGPCALVRHHGITILLTTRKTAPNDLGQWRSQGVNPEQLRWIGVKAAVAHRRAYDKIQGASFTLRTRGPCSSDLHALPYRRLRRPIYPLDPETAYR
ncbi:MAG: M81 family metallopeptidase [Acetobacteraceae bacterium]|nr:M81 family metallopeptidase [Acetobacteraceae bacterium]